MVNIVIQAFHDVLTEFTRCRRVVAMVYKVINQTFLIHKVGRLALGVIAPKLRLITLQSMFSNLVVWDLLLTESTICHNQFKLTCLLGRRKAHFVLCGLALGV
jgi:hypothetical protein